MAEDEFRRTLAQILGGFLLLLGAWTAWLQHQEDVVTAREGQTTELLTEAVAQLGNEKSLSVRLGGIYSLERIARDSKKDHWPIMEILAAFIREKASPRAAAADNLTTSSTEAASMPAQLLPDLQAALTVIGRRSVEHESDFEKLNHGVGLDLSNLNLGGALLRNADLRRVGFKGTNLQGANLGNANLSRCSLNGAILKDANLYEANLSWADVRDVDFQGAVLMFAHLTSASLQRADLTGTNVGGADFTEAVLYHANLRGVKNLTLEELRGAIYDDSTLLPDQIPESHRAAVFHSEVSPAAANE
jgi:uncharacterized protein YjbI with pentapeptide repeats